MHAEPSHWLHEISVFQNCLSPFLASANTPIINWGYLFIYCCRLLNARVLTSPVAYLRILELDWKEHCLKLLSPQRFESCKLSSFKFWRFEHQMLTRCLLQLGPELQNSRCNLHLVPTTTWSTDVYARDCIDNYGTCSQYFPMIALTIMERVASTFPCDTKNRQSGQCMLQKVAWHHKEMYTTKSVTSIWGQFLSLGFFSLGDKKKVQFELIRRIFAKEMCQNLQILRNLRFFFWNHHI